MPNPAPAAGAVPATVRNALTALIVILMGLAFAAVFGWAIYQTWTSSPTAPPTYGEAFLYVATAIAALVGGIVAVGFGQKPPQDGGPSDRRVTRNLTGLGNLAGASFSINWQAVLASAYALVYILWSVAAIATWVLRTPETPDLVKNLATTFLGMAIPIAAAYFNG